MKTPSLVRVVVFNVALAAVAASAVAQQPPPTTAKPTDEVIVLSPFSVSERAGGPSYGAEESNSATGFATKLVNVPLTINVLTADFLQEGQFPTIEDAIQRFPGIRAEARFSGTVNSRGFQAPLQRNGMNFNLGQTNTSFGANVDTSQRVEVVKGPNAVFFGNIAPGGLINYITKKPSFKNRTELSLSVGDYEYKKALLDWDHKLTDTLAVRGVLSWLDEGDGYIDYSYKKQEVGLFAVQWRPTRNVIWNINHETTSLRNNTEIASPRTHHDYWATTNGSIPISPDWVNQRAAAGQPVAQWLTRVVKDDFFPNGKKGNAGGPDQYNDRRTRVTESEILINLTDRVAVRQAAMLFKSGLDALWLASGFPRPNGIFDFTTNSIQLRREDTDIKQFETEGTIEIDLPMGKLRSLIGHEYTEVKNGFDAITGGVTGVTTWNARSGQPVHLLSYITNLEQKLAARTAHVPQAKSESNSFYSMNQLEIGDRLHVLAGVRQTSLEGRSPTGAKTPDRNETTYQVGALGEILPGLGVYGAFSTSFEPQNMVDARGNVAPPVSGRGTEFGVKAEFAEGKIGISAAYFDIKRTNIAQRDFVRELQQGLFPLFIFGGEMASEGVEAEIVYRPTRNVELSLNGAIMPKAEITANSQDRSLEGRRLQRSPENQVNLFGKYTFNLGRLKGLTVGGAIIHVGEQRLEEFNPFGLIFKPVTTADVMLSYRFPKPLLGSTGTVLRLNARNVTNKMYLDGNFIYAEPLRVYATFTFTF